MSGLNPNSLRARHRDLEVEVDDAPDRASGELCIAVPARHAHALLGRLYEEESTKARRLVDLTAIDRWVPGSGDPRPRFEVIYRLESQQLFAALRVHAQSRGVSGFHAAMLALPLLLPLRCWLQHVLTLRSRRFAWRG